MATSPKKRKNILQFEITEGLPRQPRISELLEDGYELSDKCEECKETKNHVVVIAVIDAPGNFVIGHHGWAREMEQHYGNGKYSENTKNNLSPIWI